VTSIAVDAPRSISSDRGPALGDLRAGLRRAAVFRRTPTPVVEPALGLRQRSGERLCLRRACLEALPDRRASSRAGLSSRSEEREREVSLQLTVGLGSSPQRTMIHLRTVSPARGDT
jgi:hypothetical protein